MKFNRFLSTFPLFFVSVLSFAQTRTCYTHIHNQQLMQKNPAFNLNHTKAKELPSTHRLGTGNANEKTSAGSITIPVVVHVVYNTPVQNISDAQILSQIQILNEDFSFTNPNKTSVPGIFSSVAANTDIQFCLAKRDPNGNPTTGITRTFTNQTEFYLDDEFEIIKKTAGGGHDIWDRDSYLNIWVCKLESGYLGYAQFPGGDAAFDGVVIGYNYFGTGGVTQAPYNGGRTTTHEVGHWLGLYHIWGDEPNCSGTDYVTDTPNQAGENSGCPSFPKSSCSNASDMFMNYMDYTNDACMCLFTSGQANRMNNSIVTYRNSLTSSLGCVPPSADICNGNSVLTSPFGTLSDGSLTSSYANDIACTWLIQPTGASYVTIDFINFNTESVNDTLVLYDGIDDQAPILGKYSGTSLPTTISSTGGSIFVSFKTNATVVGSGWTIDWSSNGSVPVMSCSGTQVFTTSSGTFSDGSGSDYYSSNNQCSFLIQPASGAPYITLSFSEFSTETGYDFVKIYDGNSTSAFQIGNLSGQSIPVNRHSTAGAMFVRFETDEFINGPGWTASYTSSFVAGVDEVNSRDAISIYPNPSNQWIAIKADLASMKPVTVYVLNQIGQRVYHKVYTTTVSSFVESINIEHFSDGLYKLIIEQEDRQYSKSLMKVK